ncbi:hypothetical protein [Thauera humireducens]|uniref:hypothetical protein n=1 Tax=Thauera humireducens TaxID=1134435 RepID=UPI00311D497F
MSDLSDTPQCEGACPLPERVEFAQWLLRFVDPDRSSDYRDAFWDLLRALLTQYQGDGKDGIEPSSSAPRLFGAGRSMDAVSHSMT